MAEDDDEEGIQPLIIKRITKVAGGHHGGAWKVAYADFVTAMMAFFLLLWLLSTTTPEQREGIAEYFTPTVGLKDSKGIGFQGGLTPNEQGTSRTTLTPPGLVAGQIKQGPQAKPPTPEEDTMTSEQTNGGSIVMPEGSQSQQQQQQQAKEEKDAEALKKAEEALQKMLEENAELQQMKKNIIITNTPEGLKIDVVDDPKKPIFLEGTATMTDNGRLIFRAISGVIAKTRNQISITGHTERAADAAGATYTSWELSSDRANATRRYLTSNLLETKRVARVVGMSDKELLLPKEPLNPRNRRISIVLLRGALMVDPKDMSSNRDLLSVPDVDTKKLAPKAPPPPKPKTPIEVPETKADSIFANKKKGVAPADETSDQAPGFVAPRNVPPAPPPPPPKPKPVPVAAPAAPVELPVTAPDDIFREKKGVGDAPADAPAFVAPRDLPPVPVAAPAPPKDTSPPPETPLAQPVQLPDAASPDTLFAPDKQTGEGFKAPQ